MVAKDNFSTQANLYQKYRPHYPQELYEYLYGHIKHYNTAWDCGTGNGQVASVLADHFKQVYASDISQNQLEWAHKKDNIQYFLAPAEQTELTSGSIDLITVAQALHWFNPDNFYKEVQRVAQPHCILSYWGYQLLQVNPIIDPLVKDFHDNVLGNYWDDERKILLDDYRSIKFPLIRKKQHRFDYSLNWSIDDMVGYLSSWSAVQKYIRLNNESPIPFFIRELAPKWTGNITVNFPVLLTLGQVH